jgi:hypothetical protein
MEARIQTGALPAVGWSVLFCVHFRIDVVFIPLLRMGLFFSESKSLPQIFRSNLDCSFLGIEFYVKLLMHLVLEQRDQRVAMIGERCSGFIHRKKLQLTTFIDRSKPLKLDANWIDGLHFFTERKAQPQQVNEGMDDCLS